MKYIRVNIDQVAAGLQAILEPGSTVVAEFKGENIEHLKVTTSRGHVKLAAAQYADNIQLWTPKIVTKYRVSWEILGLPTEVVFSDEDKADKHIEALNEVHHVQAVKTPFEAIDE